MNKPQNLKGFRDFLPQEKRKRDYVAGKLKEVFELYGFEPLETPTLEYSEVIMGKYGDEADKLVFQFEDNGGRKVAMRYDQTVPTSRILAQYSNELPKYFRRYQIQNVFRADKPQKGRYREFTQCDIDIFGSSDPIVDAEIMACTYFAYLNVGFKNIILRFNDRNILFEVLTPYSTETVNVFSIIQSIDKLDKMSREDVIGDLVRKGLTEENASKALKKLEEAEMSDNLKEIFRLTKELGVPEDSLEFCSWLARGLDYYTGRIFEVICPDYKNGSLGGGGRYDKLIEQLGGLSTPADGIAFGFDRIIDAATDLGLIPDSATSTKVLVTIFSKDVEDKSMKAAQLLRENKIPTEVYVNSESKLAKQMGYANDLKIPFVVVIGPDEAKSGIYTLKDMTSGEQWQLSAEDLINKLKN